MALFLNEAKVERTPVESIEEIQTAIYETLIESTESVVEAVTMIAELREAGILAEVRLSKTEKLSEGAVSDFVKRVVAQIKVIIGKVWANIKNVVRKVLRYLDVIVGRFSARGIFELPEDLVALHKQLPGILENGLKIVESPYNSSESLEKAIKVEEEKYDALMKRYNEFLNRREANGEKSEPKKTIAGPTINACVSSIKRTVKALEAAEAKMNAEADKIGNDNEAKAAKDILLKKISFAAKFSKYSVRASATLIAYFGSLKLQTKEDRAQEEEEKKKRELA